MAAVVVVAATLRRRRFRLLAGLVAGAAAAAGLTAGIFALLSAVLGAERPAGLTINQACGSWLSSVAFPARRCSPPRPPWSWRPGPG
jgi:hypothetical protein